MTQSGAPTGGAEGPVVLVLLYATLLTVWNVAGLVAAVPLIREAFADQPNAELMAQTALTAPALFIALFSPVAGWLLDRVGRRAVLAGASLLYVVAGPAGLWVDDLPTLIASRGLLGIAVAGSMNAAVTLVGDLFEGEARRKVMGWQSATLEFGGVIFIPLCGWLATFGWRTPFLIYLAALPLVFLALAYVPRTAGEAGRSRSEPRPAIPWTARRLALVLAVVGFTGMAAFYAIPLQVPFRLLELGVADPLAQSLATAAPTLFAGLVAASYARLGRLYSFSRLFALAFTLMATGLAVLAIAWIPALVYLGAGVTGLGMGLFLPNCSAWVVSAGGPEARARLVGILMTGVFLGQFAAPFLMRPLAAAQGRPAVFALAAASLAILATVFFLVRSTPAPQPRLGTGA